MIYMFRLESWNIMPSQYREWGADLSVDGDGGFIVTFFGREFDFGSDPKVEFGELRDCY